MTLLRFAWRNLGRRQLRSAFTVTALALVVTAFVLIRAVQEAWYNTSKSAHEDRLDTQDAVSYATLIPRNYADEVARLPHVKQTTYWNWFGGRDPAHPKEFFPTIAVDEQHYFDVFSEHVISDDARKLWREKRNAAIVGEVLAAKLGWKVGDRVSLESGFYPEQARWAFEIVGFYSIEGRSLNRSLFCFRWDYFNELAADWHNDRVLWIASTIDDPSRATEIAEQIDAHFRGRGQQTFTQPEDQFNASFGEGLSAMMKALTAASGALLLIMVLLVGNTISMGVRERTSEFATLRAIGFSPWQVVASIAGEAALLGALGGIAGLGLSYPIIQRLLGGWIRHNVDVFLPYFEVGASTAGIALGATLVVSACAAALPAYRIFHLSVASALRRVA
jgi:putative ABC transport system permease protein